MESTTQHPLHGVQALVFDLMGTCTDWHSSILAAMRAYPLPPPLRPADLPTLALDWRAAFFRAIFASFAAGEPAPDIDTVHARTLLALLRARGVAEGDGEGPGPWDAGVRQKLVQAWHIQQAWPDSIEGIRRLKGHYMVVVLANGTTRLQLDVVRSAHLPFDTLFSSQLLRATKPDPAIYLSALDLLGLRPEQTAMVAAHAYDLRAAAKVGMKTVYVQRSTEDPDENMNAVRAEVDVFVDAASPVGGGLLALADLLNA